MSDLEINNSKPEKLNNPNSYLKNIPNGWELMGSRDNGKSIVYKGNNGLYVMYEVFIVNKERWTHLKIGRKSKQPSVNDICIAKNLFIDPNVTAIVNIPPVKLQKNNDVHLWYNNTTEMFSLNTDKGD